MQCNIILLQYILYYSGARFTQRHSPNLCKFWQPSENTSISVTFEVIDKKKGNSAISQQKKNCDDFCLTDMPSFMPNFNVFSSVSLRTILVKLMSCVSCVLYKCCYFCWQCLKYILWFSFLCCIFVIFNVLCKMMCKVFRSYNIRNMAFPGFVPVSR